MVARDPQKRSEIARKAGLARHSTDVYIRALVERAPELTAEQIERLRALLTPSGGDRHVA